MFDIGFWELALIGLLALIVLGPKRLPEAARSAGRWVGRLRQYVANVKQDLNRELQDQDLAEFRRLRDELNAARQTLQESSRELLDELPKGGTPVPDYLVEARPDEIGAPAGSRPKTKAKTQARSPAARARGSKKKAQTKRPATARPKAVAGKQTAKKKKKTTGPGRAKKTTAPKKAARRTRTGRKGQTRVARRAVTDSAEA